MAMIASLSHHLRVFFKLSVRYAALSFVTHTKLNVVVLTSATHAFNISQLTTNAVQIAGKTNLKSLKTRLKQSLSQLQVWCTHNKDGCRWSGELGDLEHHLKTGVHSGELFHRAGWEYCIHCQRCCQELARKLMLCVCYHANKVNC